MWIIVAGIHNSTAKLVENFNNPDCLWISVDK